MKTCGCWCGLKTVEAAVAAVDDAGGDITKDDDDDG